MRKIPETFENPFDNILISMADKMNPYFHSASLTPNDLTTISLVLSIMAVYFLIKGCYQHAIILFLVSYFFDCCDGHYARSYNMETKFGDYYDHYGDIIKHLLLFFALYKMNPVKFKKIIPYGLFVIFLALVHLGCQEVYYGKYSSNTLNTLKYFCPANKDNVESYLKITRFFGCGTSYLFMAWLIYWFSK